MQMSAQLQYVRCLQNEGNEASLTLGDLYHSLPLTPSERESGMIRIVDNEGEDYLYPAHWFEPVPLHALVGERSEQLTVHLDTRTKLSVRDIANERGITMSALVREWIDEHLDLSAVSEER
jgi:hypothetical protein